MTSSQQGPKIEKQMICTSVALIELVSGVTSMMSRDVQIIAFSIFGPCCDDVIALALALQVGELWRQNLNLKRESSHLEGRRVDPGSKANI